MGEGDGWRQVKLEGHVHKYDGPRPQKTGIETLKCLYANIYKGDLNKNKCRKSDSSVEIP